MPAEIYEIVALAARFWFLFLMALIVWRSYRWYAKERRLRKKRLRILPDAGYIGELVVLKGAGDLEEGAVLSVPFEGTLGFVRSNDLCVPAPGVSRRHLWFSYDARSGLVLTALGRSDFAVDELTIAQQPGGLCMQHGSRLYIGDAELRLRMFAGYEVGMVLGPGRNDAPPVQDPQAAWDAWLDQLGSQQTAQPQQWMPYTPWQSSMPPAENQAVRYVQRAAPYAAPQQPQPMWVQEAPMPQPQWMQQPPMPQAPAAQPQWAAQAAAPQPQWAAPEPQSEPQWAPEADAPAPAAPIGQPVAAKAFRVDEATLQTMYGTGDDDAWFAGEDWGSDTVNVQSAPQVPPAAPSPAPAYAPAEDEWDEPPVFHPLVEDEDEDDETEELQAVMSTQPERKPASQAMPCYSAEAARRMDDDEPSAYAADGNIFAAAYSANLRRAAEQKPAPKAAPAINGAGGRAAGETAASTGKSLYTVSYMARPEQTGAPAPAEPAAQPKQAPAARTAANGLLKTAPLRVPGSRPAGTAENPEAGGDAQ